ncbi:DNA ligase LigA-related protein [Shouchella clausii]|uniref:DNA ligase LigA-related protein n=1 Tax=Shouchella clausii TaxID=79880 RepID=UPI001C732C5D|nr:hypothetical protein [Shouchella clausii]MBX0320256.1 hypothetical protein [Shouchella clausii]MEB5480727.1 hypothetical protein [Shouchella clausii]
MDEIKELINRRRRQIMIHSCIYYAMDKSIISDHTYDQWCKELAELQAKYPETAAKCVYAKEFQTFDGSSGYDLPTHYFEVISTARRLVYFHETKNV